jgi:hypothetical protein
VALGLGATVRHLRDNRLERRFALLMIASGLPGVIIGASVILHVPGRMAEIALGILTLGLSVYSFLSPKLGQHYHPQHRDRNGYLIGGAALFFIGFLNGSLTSGTGLFATLWLVRWFGMDYTRAVAYTLVLVGIFWNATGAITLGMLGDIYWLWIPALLLGSVLGGYLGAHLAIVKGNTLIKRSFELVTLLIGMKLIIG